LVWQKAKGGKSFIKLGKVFEWNGEGGFEVGGVRGLGGAVLLLHHQHDTTTRNRHAMDKDPLSTPPAGGR
jgi:hypothetical protein